MKIRKKLNESLIENAFTVVIPIKVKIKIEHENEKDVLLDLSDTISTEVMEEVEYQTNRKIESYLRSNKEKITTELGIDKIKISRLYVNMDDFDTVPISSGVAFFDIENQEPIEEGKAKKLFNTILHNNVVDRESTITIKDDNYDSFNVVITIIKNGEIEIGEY